MLRDYEVPPAAPRPSCYVTMRCTPPAPPRHSLSSRVSSSCRTVVSSPANATTCMQRFGEVIPLQKAFNPYPDTHLTEYHYGKRVHILEHTLVGQYNNRCACPPGLIYCACIPARGGWGIQGEYIYRIKEFVAAHRPLWSAAGCPCAVPCQVAAVRQA